MREPRGHGAMSGAILQPPTRAGRRLGRALHRGLRLPADVRARDDRRRDRAGGDGDGGGHRARDGDPARHAGRARRGARGGAGRRGDRGDAAQRAVVPRAPRRDRRAAGRVRSSTTSRSAATSTRSSTPRRWTSQVDPERARRADRRGRAGDGARSRTRIARSTRPTSASPGSATCIFTAPGRDGADARAAVSIHPGWLDRSPCGTGTSARMAQLHARGELALNTDFVHESVIGTRFTGRLVGETEVGGRAGGDPRDHRPRVDHRDGPVPARPERPVPGRLHPQVAVRPRWEV